jgi:peptidyl-prolyl cis-trans isomerase D
MTKIRDNLTKAFAVFAGVFVVYIVLDWGMDITGRKHSTRALESQRIGIINGQPVNYQEYQELVRQVAENQKNQTGVDPDEDQLRTIRDQTWNQLVENHLMEEEYKRFGITVSDQEIIDAIRGPNPPDFLRQQFTDSLGNFNRQAYESAILDPRNRNVIVSVENIVRSQRRREKLQSLVLASVRVTEGELMQRFADQNVKYEADIAFIDPVRMVKDEEIAPTESDLRSYYNDHADEYKTEATRKLKYVYFSLQASAADSQGVLADMQDIRRRLDEGADFHELAKTYSETPISDAFFKHGELSEVKERAVFSSKPGQIVGPLLEPDGYHLIRVEEFRNGKDESAHARHILIMIDQNDSVSALKQAREVLADARRGEDFAQLARTHSKDQGSAQRGGDLGWFGKGRMVKPFEEAVFSAKIGQIVGPVKTQFGYHIIQVLARDSREVKISDIHIGIKTSSQTRGDVAQLAEDFAYIAKRDGFDREAEQSKYTVQETGAFQHGALIPGVGVNPHLNRFAFDNKVGSVSEAIQLPNGYGVFTVSEVKQAGVRPFEEVKSAIESRVKREKQMERARAIARELRQTLSATDSLQKLTSIRPEVTVQHLSPTILGGGFLPMIGRDPGLIGGIARLEPGELSQPIDGTRGVYLVKLLSKTPFDSGAFTAQKDNLRSQLLSEKRNRFYNDWFEQLKKSAEIVDNRDLFYR